VTDLMIDQHGLTRGSEPAPNTTAPTAAIVAADTGMLRGARIATRRRLLLLAAGACSVALSACTYYVPTTVPGAPASFDRSFSAASGAMRDNGLSVTVEDRSAGRVVGAASAGGNVSASVRSQADGSVRVQFDSQELRDPTLLDRVVRAYEARMGR